MAIDKRLHQTILGLANYLNGKKDEPSQTESMCLEFLGEVMPIMLDPAVEDRHLKLRKTCIEFSVMWREALHEGH